VSVTLVFGIGGMVIGNSDFALSGISLCAICALALNLVLPGGQGWRSKTVLEEPDL
jgi:uracil permease